MYEDVLQWLQDDEMNKVHCLYTQLLFQRVKSAESNGCCSQLQECSHQCLLLVEKYMKGYVGVSPHEKKRNKNVPTLRQEVIDNPIPIYIFVSF